MMSIASSEEVWPLLDVIVLRSSVVIADLSNQLTTVGDNIGKNLNFMIV